MPSREDYGARGALDLFVPGQAGEATKDEVIRRRSMPSWCATGPFHTDGGRLRVHCTSASGADWASPGCAGVPPALL